MREISPAENMSAEEFLSLAPPQVQQHAGEIRAKKPEGLRLRPSARLVDRSALLTPELRAKIAGAVAVLVDENLFGRPATCIQFAALLQRALAHLRLPGRTVAGWAMYYSAGREGFRWENAWCGWTQKPLTATSTLSSRAQRCLGPWTSRHVGGQSRRRRPTGDSARTTGENCHRPLTFPPSGGLNCGLGVRHDRHGYVPQSFERCEAHVLSGSSILLQQKVTNVPVVGDHRL
jgi:hypothetical protein